MKREYCKPEIEINSFIANEYVSTCYTGSCRRKINGSTCGAPYDSTEAPFMYRDMGFWGSDEKHSSDNFWDWIYARFTQKSPHRGEITTSNHS